MTVSDAIDTITRTSAQEQQLLPISMSAAGTWQSCEQKYYYSYIDRLRPIAAAPAPELGSALHAYLAAYYSLINQEPPLAAHSTALNAATREWSPKFESWAEFSQSIGDDATAKEFSEMPDRFDALCRRYYQARGEADAERWEVLMVEQTCKVLLIPGVESTSIIDLVVRERDGYQRTHLVEHKSTKSVPPTGIRLRDFQTVLYSAVLGAVADLRIDAVTWNYLRTEEPTVPQLLKNRKAPELSRAKNIDTTWQVYLSQILEHGLNVEDYAEMQDILEPKLHKVWFPRFEHVIVADTTEMMNNYIEVAQRIRMAKVRWKSGQKPLRTLSRNCEWCQFRSICEAHIMGGDEEGVISRYFRKGGSR